MANVRQTINDLRERRRQIENNPDLTSTGKQKLLDGWEQERDAARAGVLSGLALSWQVARTELETAEEAGRDAIERSAGSWDYGRLSYCLAAVQSRLAAAEGLEEGRALFTAGLDGDRHSARVWAEFGPGLLFAKYGRFEGGEGETWLDLNTTGKRKLEQLTQDDGLRAAQENGRKIATEIRSLSQLTGEAKNFFDGDDHVFEGRSDFDALSAGLRISEKYDPTVGGFYSRVELA